MRHRKKCVYLFGGGQYSPITGLENFPWTWLLFSLIHKETLRIPSHNVFIREVNFNLDFFLPNCKHLWRDLYILCGEIECILIICSHFVLWSSWNTDLANAANYSVRFLWAFGHNIVVNDEHITFFTCVSVWKHTR